MSIFAEVAGAHHSRCIGTVVGVDVQFVGNSFFFRQIHQLLAQAVVIRILAPESTQTEGMS